MRFGVKANTTKELALKMAVEIAEYLQNKGVEAIIDYCTAKKLNKMGGDIFSCEKIIVIGGDGTILSAAVEAAKRDIAVLGINLGNLGFLSEVEPIDAKCALDRLIAGDYLEEKRAMLEIQLEEGKKHYALNDCIVFKKEFSHTIEVNISVDNMDMGSYRCDGMIISSPTGSTAYSLSAGGPVVYPNVRGLLITPVNSHSLSTRPVMVGEKSVVCVKVSGMQGASVSADGNPISGDFSIKDKAIITTAELCASFIHIRDYNFFELVKKKLY